MSKMSQLAMELDEQSAELGYDGLQDALNNGYSVVYDEDGVHLEKIDIEKEQEEAHKAWLKEKEECIRKLELTLEHVDLDDVDHVQDAINFIKGVKYES